MRDRYHSSSINPSYPPLRVTVSRTVRFEEVDPLKIMWHGHYCHISFIF